MFRAILPAAFAALAALMLSGCGALTALGEATTPLDAYELRAPAEGPVARGRPLARDLIVELPTTSGALDTDRILIRPHPLQAQYLPRSRWSDPTPLMLQTLMLRSLENTGALRYVARRPLGAAGDFALISEITDFQAELDENGDSATIRLRLNARIVRESDAAIIASRSFAASAASASLDTLVLVEGFDAALAVLLQDLAGWVMASLGVPVAAEG
jgi:cholesterol transport system auxiliary component